jgi:hypothetical protein
LYFDDSGSNVASINGVASSYVGIIADDDDDDGADTMTGVILEGVTNDGNSNDKRVFGAEHK